MKLEPIKASLNFMGSVYYQGMAAPNPREVAELANEIVQVEDHLAALRAKWESLFNGTTEPKKPIGRPPHENSVAAQVLMVINSDASQYWDAEQMAQHLNADRDTVATALYNLFAAKKIARHSRGKYEAVNPYADQIAAQLEKERTAA